MESYTALIAWPYLKRIGIASKAVHTKTFRAQIDFKDICEMFDLPIDHPLKKVVIFQKRRVLGLQFL